MLQKSILKLLFIPIVSIVLLYATQTKEAQIMKERTGSVDISHGSAISDIPYGFGIESLSPSMIKIISSLDMSTHAGKRLFAGYGVYDKERNQCKYLDSGITKQEFERKFHYISTFNGHSYAISREAMSYTSCKALAATYNADIFNPASAAENSAVIGSDKDMFGEDGWLGVYRKNCDESYLNVKNENQLYTNFYDKIDNCSPDKLYVSKKENSSAWFKSNSNEMHKCIIEINSLDVTRPVEVCAPWWRIERTYKVTPSDEISINGVSLDPYSINQATLPMRMTTCLKYDTNATQSQIGNRDVICKTYYDMTMGAQCQRDIFQPSCFVDTCQGYVYNVCSKNAIQPTHVDGMKDYEWGYISVGGNKVKAKIKQNIRSWAYSCPPSGSSLKKCQILGDVIVFPHQCNPAICTEYKKCIGTKKNVKECYSKYPCEEVYGDSTQPVLENGNLVGFRDKCGEEMIVNRNIDKISNYTEKCAKYKTITDVITKKQKCTNTAKEVVYEVNTTITQEDAYANRKDCIRINNIESAQPRLNLVFNYKNEGFFNLALTKSFSDGTQKDNINKAPNTLANDLQYLSLKEKSNKGSQAPTQDKTLNCKNSGDSKWDDKRISSYVQNPDSNETVVLSGLSAIIEMKRRPKTSPCLSSEVFDGTRCYLDSNKDGGADINNTFCPIGKRYTLENSAPKRCIAPKLLEFKRVAVVDTIKHAAAIRPIIDFDAVDVGGMIDLDRIDIGYAKLLTDSSVSVTKQDIITGKYILVGGNKTILGDEILYQSRLLTNNADFSNSQIELNSGNFAVKGAKCKEFAACHGFEMQTIYVHDNEAKQCKVTSNNEVDDINPIVDNNAISEEYPEFKTKEDSFATSIDGHSDIFSIQEYADGKFGYASNYHFLLPKNNQVSIDGKELFPILRQHPIDLPLLYDFYVSQRTQNTKNKAPLVQTGSYEGSVISPKDNINTAILAAAGGLGIGVAAALVMNFSFMYAPIGMVIGIIIALFAPNEKWGDMATDWRIYKVLSERYVENIYGYDLRMIDSYNRIEVYSYEKLKTPTAKKKDWETMFENHRKYKKTSLYWQGYEKNLVDNILLRSLDKTRINYPGKCKWYKPRCRKVNKKAEGPNILKITKQVNNVYLGSTNNVSIFVPYLGDYVVGAYSKSGAKLGEVVVESDDFMESTGNMMAYANIAFALSPSFNLAPGMKDGNTTNACRYDHMTEWGGGVSGVYFENQTPQNNICSKSNDKYVQGNYADYLLVRPVKSNNNFKVKMIKPMPYANRFSLVTFGKLETRKYKCYEMGPPCDPENIKK